jgi:hypothetical protein
MLSQLNTNQPEGQPTGLMIPQHSTTSFLKAPVTSLFSKPMATDYLEENGNFEDCLQISDSDE